MAETRDLSVPTLLFIDVESSGLIRDDLPLGDVGQPWPMQVSAMLCNEAGSVVNLFSHLIKAEGRTAKENAVKVHGISAWATAQVGVPEPRVLGLLSDMLRTVPMTAMKVISFSDFDRRLISSAFARFGESQGKPSAYARLWEARPGTEYVSLQSPWLQQVCRLNGEIAVEYKWPSLIEATETVLGRRPDRLISTDKLFAVRDLYFALKQRGLFGREEAA